jgi:Universal stress protein family
VPSRACADQRVAADLDDGGGDEASEHGADLIVMGARRSRIKHLFFGDLVEKTRRRARCPVLTAKADPRSSLFVRETSRR